jgi:hypothetical protein
MGDSTNVKGFTLENARALDDLLNEVPLDESEVWEVINETGVDVKRLAARMRTRLVEVQMLDLTNTTRKEIDAHERGAAFVATL